MRTLASISYSEPYFVAEYGIILLMSYMRLTRLARGKASTSFIQIFTGCSIAKIMQHVLGHSVELPQGTEKGF